MESIMGYMIEALAEPLLLLDLLRRSLRPIHELADRGGMAYPALWMGDCPIAEESHCVSG